MSGYIIEKLRRGHAVEDFDCGKDPLNRFLIGNALQSQLSNASQTYVLRDGEQIVGYHTLVVGDVEYDDAPERLKKGLARHPVPLMILARLAVRKDRQGQGLGAALLKDAFLRTLQAADIAGIRALALHVKDEDALAFYNHFGFIAAPANDRHLFILLKDIKTLFL